MVLSEKHYPKICFIQSVIDLKHYSVRKNQTLILSLTIVTMQPQMRH